MALDSFTDIQQAILGSINEPIDGSSGWLTEVQDIIQKQHRRLISHHPYGCLEKDPPAILIVPAAITSDTVTIASGSTAGTFGGTAYLTQSFAGWKFTPNSKAYALRILTHTLGLAAFTAAGAPDTLTASAGTLYQDEFSLPSDLNFIMNCGWADNGAPITVISDERARQDGRIQPSSAAWPPGSATRLGKSKLRFSNYPGVGTGAKMVEIPYVYDPGDPSGASALAIEPYLRTLLMQLALGPAHRLKRNYAQANTEEMLSLKQLSDAVDTESRRLRAVRGHLSNEQRRAAYS